MAAALVVAMGLLVAGGTFVYFAQRTGYMMLEQQAHVKAHAIAELMNGIVEHAMLEGQSDHLDRLWVGAGRSCER